MEKQLITIVLPTKNAERFMPRIERSFKEQERPFEIFGLVKSEIISEYGNFKNVSLSYVSETVANQQFYEQVITY